MSRLSASKSCHFGPPTQKCGLPRWRRPLPHAESQSKKRNSTMLLPLFLLERFAILLKPPADLPYDVLPWELIRRTGSSERWKLQQIFTAEHLGDRKPTQLLRRMEQLMGDYTSTTDNAFLRELFLQRPPSQVRMVLASTDDTVSLVQLAQLADKILEVAVPTPVTIPYCYSTSPLFSCC